MFRIRFARKEDIQSIVDFQIQMALESEGLDLDRDTLSKGVFSVFNDPQKGQYFVAEDNKTVIASMLTTYEWSDWRNQTIYWLQSVYVLPGYRGKRVFSQLYNHVKQLVKENEKVGGIRLYVDHSNSHAINVYEALGMNGDHYKTYEWMK
jgi:ribosomal protein S18 acetylase RimI-like enzyme